MLRLDTGGELPRVKLGREGEPEERIVDCGVMSRDDHHTWQRGGGGVRLAV